jgi:two-component system sensor histidine kinase VicK
MTNEYLVGGLGGLGLIVLLFLALYYLGQRHKPLGERKKKFEQEDIETDFILDTIEDGVAMVTGDGVVHLFNPAAGRISGWVPAEAVSLDYKLVLNLVDDKGQPLSDIHNAFTQALATGRSTRDTDATLVTKDGRKIPVSVIVSPVINTIGQPNGSVVAVFRDIAKEKETATQRSDFISTASHEMRTPLAAIEGYLALALNPKTAQIDANARNLLEKASNSTKHLGDLFRDLLTSSKAEDGRLISYPSAIEIGEILEQVAEAAKFPAKSKGLELSYSVSANDSSGGSKVVRPLYYAYVDPNRIREVFQNIVDNAIKYTNEGQVMVRLTGDVSITQIQVQDSGAGIPAEDIPHLFQKFYRVDNSSTRAVGGTGLGLFICRKITELYNGRIWVESQYGKGSTFFINLPRLNAQQALEIQHNQAATISPMDKPL